MTQRNINATNVVGDMENFIDSLLSHAEEDNCTHSVMDLLAEFFDNSSNNKNRRVGVGRPDKASNTMALQDRRHNDDQATNPEYYDK
jgi:hypothetical protein